METSDTRISRPEDAPAAESRLRERSARALEEKIAHSVTLAANVASLQSRLANARPEILVRIYLLNRGATDGLVRQSVTSGIEARISSFNEPSRQNGGSSAAVPVFQTNSKDAICRHNPLADRTRFMSEFWYRFTQARSLAIQPGTLCDGASSTHCFSTINNESASKPTAETACPNVTKEGLIWTASNTFYC